MKTLSLKITGAASAQTVIVNNLDEASAAKLRSAIDASFRAAASGQRVGLVTGQVNPQPERSRDGTVRQELDASTLMFSVARVGSDGRVETVCTTGAESAQKALKAPAFAKRYTLAAKA